MRCACVLPDQVEADIRPFRGLLLGLFFVTTGGSIDMGVLRSNWNTISWILVGLITVKTAVVAALGPSFGLSKCVPCPAPLLLSHRCSFPRSTDCARRRR